MLYLTTRDRADSFTAYRVLSDDRASDGGMFIPIQMPSLCEEDILALKNKSFGETIAYILNLFFERQISGWDIEFCVGRSPFRLSVMNHRLVIAELWHNHGADYHYLEHSIYAKLCGSSVAGKRISEWPQIGIRIAVLFGIFSELLRCGYDRFDIAVPAGDFRLPVAVWYAGNMGLPVGMTICGCDGNSGIWDLIHRGEFSTAVMDNAELGGVERLVFDAFGREEAHRYLSACQRRTNYKLTEEQRETLSGRLYAAVASKQRVASIIKSVYRTNQYILDLDAAVSYGALQDYRARTGESKLTLILADRSPALLTAQTCKALGLSNDELKKMLNVQKE